MKVDGILRNKYFLKGLERVSDHATTCAAGASFVASTIIRPLVIMATPDTEKENKQYAASNSICSGVIKFGLVAALSVPIENAIKKIDKEPKKFLSQKTISSFTKDGVHLSSSRKYNFAAQLLKLGINLITAVPKSMLTIALIPIVMDKFFNKKAEAKREREVAFGGEHGVSAAKWVGKIFEFEWLQNFAQKHQYRDKDIAKHITAATDVLLTGTFVHQTSKSKKIKENRKKALIYNNIISTAVTLIGGYAVDGVIKSKSDKFIEKFKKANAGDPKLGKYIQGINILRPILIFAGIYYCTLPLFSTYMAEKIDKFTEKKNIE